MVVRVKDGGESKDLTLYQERAPQNAVYDKSAKRYVASDRYEPRSPICRRHNHSGWRVACTSGLPTAIVLRATPTVL